jgi:hypothetical protein
MGRAGALPEKIRNAPREQRAVRRVNGLDFNESLIAGAQSLREAGQQGFNAIRKERRKTRTEAAARLPRGMVGNPWISRPAPPQAASGSNKIEQNVSGNAGCNSLCEKLQPKLDAYYPLKVQYYAARVDS